MPSDAPRIAARGLRLARRGPDGPLPVLAGVDIDAAPGELVALIGPSGCGKSTLLEVLAGLLSPDAGDVLLDGRPATDRLGRLALLPQRDALLPWRTVQDNVAVALTATGIGRRQARERAAVALGRYGLAEFLDHYPAALSGGMRQRVTLARTLLAGPRAWLLDEPFRALDALTRAALWADLTAVRAEHAPTAILVTHDLDEALLLADRVLVSTARPARVHSELAVDLERRDIDIISTPEFGGLRGRLTDLLRAAGAGL